MQCVAVFCGVLQCAAVCSLCSGLPCYGVATMSRRLKMIGLFGRISSLL